MGGESDLHELKGIGRVKEGGDGRSPRPSSPGPRNSGYFFLAFWTFPSTKSYSTMSPVFSFSATTVTASI